MTKGSAAWEHTNVMYAPDCDLLVLLTLVACIALLTTPVELACAPLNSRPVLAPYAFVRRYALFAFISLANPAQRRYTFALSRTLSHAWSECYTLLVGYPRGTKPLLKSKGMFTHLS